MAYSRRRPTGGYGVSIFATPSKDTFESAVSDCGFTSTVTKVDKGQWNERREFVVNGTVVGVAFKGEKPGWEYMTNAVYKMAREG